MSQGYSAAFLKMQLRHFQACERFFQSPIDLELLKSQIHQKEDEESSGRAGSSTISKSYTDFLLPLPEHLQPTEIGIPDPAMIQKRRTEKGMNEPQNSQDRNLRNELKAKAELKNQLKNRPSPGYQPEAPSPKMQRKIKIAPRPGGTTSQEIEEE